MKIMIGAAILAAMVVPAHAQGLGSMQIATALGSVLASEKACGLSYDQAAIAAYIEDNVSAEDMSFTSTLQMMTAGQEMQIADLSPSSKTAHCTQVARVAKSYKFVK
jgi:hypothetical protein